jgi:hypothetical protein
MRCDSWGVAFDSTSGANGTSVIEFGTTLDDTDANAPIG